MNLAQSAQEFESSLAHLYDAAEAKSLFLRGLEQLFGWNRTHYLLHQQEDLSNRQAKQILELLAELLTGKPIQYIFGETEFYGLVFKVNPSVLIPRPETEELVKWILDTCGEQSLNDARILDIGTGCGCIPITLKKYLPGASISAMDISAAALQTAQANAELLAVEVNFIRQDVLQADLPVGTYELMVSNPPYVTFSEKEQMRPNVLEHEPHTALFVPDEDPLLFYRHIADLALTHLSPNGYLFFEINEYLGQATVQLLQGKGFIDIELRKDLPGKDRMIRCKLS